MNPTQRLQGSKMVVGSEEGHLKDENVKKYLEKWNI